MKRLPINVRNKRLLHQAVRDFQIDLEGISVLTEAASGPFVVTPLLAAMAGADAVYALSRDSRYGAYRDVVAHTLEWAEELGLTHRIVVSDALPVTWAPKSNLVTNLGFVRPITGEFLQALPWDAAVALMWEPWEFRPQDLDLEACTRLGIPVLGTNEHDLRLQTFRYVGLLAIKLLLEQQVELCNNRIAVVGGGYFGDECQRVLQDCGASVMHLKPQSNWVLSDEQRGFLHQADAVVFAEHHFEGPLVATDQAIHPDWLVANSPELIHISGFLSEPLFELFSLKKTPAHFVPPRVMTVTTDLVGPKPVVDLHAAGLKVGSEVVRGKRLHRDPALAVAHALANSPAMDWAVPQFLRTSEH